MTEEDIRNYLILKILEKKESHLHLNEHNKKFWYRISVPTFGFDDTSLEIETRPGGYTRHTVIFINVDPEIYYYVLENERISIGFEELLEYKILLEL